MALRTPIVVACWSFFVAVVGGTPVVVGRWLEAGYLPAVRLRGRMAGRYRRLGAGFVRYLSAVRLCGRMVCRYRKLTAEIRR